MSHNLHIYENAENTSRAVAELIKDGDIFEVSKPNNSNEILFTLKKNEKIDLNQIV